MPDTATRPAPRRRPRPALVAALIVAALTVALLVPWRVNFLRGWAEQRVEDATGRAFRIEGDVWWRWIPMRLDAHQLRFANPPWAGRPQMLTVDHVTARIAFWPLLRGQLELPAVTVTRPDLWLETVSSTGKAGEPDRRNWYLDRQQSDGGKGVQLGRVKLDAGQVTYRDASDDTQLVVRLATMEADLAEGGKGSRLQAEMSGRWRGLAAEGRGIGDDVLRLRDTSQPYGLDVSARIGGTRVAAAGTIAGLTMPQAADLKVAVSGPSLGQWYRIVGIGLPDTPPYRTAGRVRLEQGVWRYQDFTSRVGASDLGGDVSFVPREPRPLIRGQLVSKQLRLKDLGPTFGAAPAPAASAASTPARADGDSGDGASRKVLPQRSFSAAKWDTLDADITFEGQSVQDIGSLPLDRLRMRVTLNDRRLTLDPFSLGVAGGTVAGGLIINGQTQPMRAYVDARFNRLDLDDLLPSTQTSKAAVGKVTGRVKLAGHGQSYAQLLGSADGEAQLAMGRGRISNLLLELAGLDAAEALRFWVRGDRQVGVRCALVDTTFESGIVKPRTILFDTTDTIVTAEGQVNLRNETLDLTVRPQPKDVSPLTLRVPIHVRGTLGDPALSPDKAGLLARGGGAIVLGFVAPWAAWVPLIETGPGEDSDCRALIARARGEGVEPPDATPSPGRAQKTQNRK